ncbi:hypothetical protein [Actinoplanes flavus]|uniref:ATP-grasp target RiPP n=1 Tax=Actinoplanes flavus TaxID=2820290 RepID=A0ABS3UK82_9ACTN|nr:hypothetical protein [Actinoplanes flavus]MBO3739183.1 hypothetical protein [Actinoplanes flavus]
MRAMQPSGTGSSPDRFRLTVDGDVFDVATQPGAYHYTRLTGPAPGHGSTSRQQPNASMFLDMVDPSTGYIEDDGQDTPDQ